jgi:hypothetical protein
VCKKLAPLVIRDEDVTKCEIDIEELVDFMRLQAKYADFADNTGPIIGQPVS